MSRAVHALADLEEVGLLAANRSPGRLALRRFFRHRLAAMGLGIILFLIVACLIGPYLSPFDPVRISMTDKFAGPLGGKYLLGGDELGRDVLTRLLTAGRVSLTVGLCAMAISVIVGTVAGSAAGYYGGVVDGVIMRFVDAMLCFPTIFLLLAMAAFVKPSLITITLIVAVTSWMGVARLVHGQMRALREREFAVAAHAIGAPNWYIVRRQLLPNAVAPIVVAATLNVANAILLESYISFLGYGIQPPVASWGNMLNNAQTYFNAAPWVAVFPGFMITLAVTSFNFLGDGLRDALDPHLGQD